MRTIDRALLNSCVRALARVLIRFSLRHMIKIQEIERSLREVFVAEAKRALQREGTESSHSRLSIITGLSRREIAKIEEKKQDDVPEPTLVMKVLGQWQSDKRFLTKERAPKPLTFGTLRSEFHKLVALVSKDLNPATVLFELLRVGAIEEREGKVILKLESYRPKGDAESGFAVLTKDIQYFIQTVEENVFYQPDIGNLHLRTEYDRVRADALVDLKAWLLKEGNELHARARKKFSEYDQDVRPDPQYKGEFLRVVLCSFGKVFQSHEEES